MAAPCGLGSDDLADHTFPLQAVQRLQPGLTQDKALRLARAFERIASTCGVDWRLLVSIAYHESSLIDGKVNHDTQDYGLMQINSNTALRFGLSRDRLLKDPSYSIEAACRLLTDNRMRYGAKYSFWLGIYRSGTALNKSRIVANAKSYDRMIRTTAQQIGYATH